MNWNGASSQNLPDNFLDLLASKIAEKLKKDLPNDDIQTEYLSTTTIAKILDCSTSEVRKQLQVNKIPSLKFGKSGYRVSRKVFEERLRIWECGGNLWD